MKISNTELVCSSLKMTPKAKLDYKASQDCLCGYCGKTILSGESVDKLSFKKTFIDQSFVVNPTSSYMCKYCVEVLGNSAFLMKLSTGLYTVEGAYPVGKKIERAYFILNPPKPPFVFSIQQGKSQHMIWRSPINLSREIVFVQLGSRTLSIKVQRLKEAAKKVFSLKDIYCKWKENATSTSGKKTKKPKVVKRSELRPLSYSDIKANQTNLFELGFWLKELIRNEQIKEADLEFLHQLSWGESWFLDAVTSEDDYSQQPNELTL